MCVHAVRVVACDLARFRIHRSRSCDTRSRRFDDDTGDRILGERESKEPTALRGGHLRLDLSIRASVQRNAVVVWACSFSTMAIGKLARFWRCSQTTDLWDDCEVTIVSHPDCGLMRADETCDRWVIVVVGHYADLVLACLRRPVRHAEWRRDKGHSAAVPDCALLRTYQRIDERNSVLIGRYRRERAEGEDTKSSNPLHTGNCNCRD